MAKCKFCPVQITWRKTKNGKPMPLEEGKVSILDKHGEIRVGEIIHWGRCNDKRPPKPPIFGMGKGETEL